jgi:hypothetical protein
LAHRQNPRYVNTEVRAEQTIDLPYQSVRDALLADSGKWLPSLAEDAASRLVTELGVNLGKVRVARAVQVEVSPPTIYPDRCQLYVAWRAAEMPALFPELTGAFELLPLPPRQSRLSFDGRYVPPGRAVGRLVDRVLMHRVAEASVQEFVTRTAGMLESAAQGSISNGGDSQ